jgi:hypothetical protein
VRLRNAFVRRSRQGPSAEASVSDQGPGVTHFMVKEPQLRDGFERGGPLHMSTSQLVHAHCHAPAGYAFLLTVEENDLAPDVAADL